MAKFANFEVHVEIEKLKIHVKGDREIAPEVAQNVEHHIAGMFQTAGLIEAPKDGENGNRVVDAQPPAAMRSKRRARKSTSGGFGDGTGPAGWNHDPAKWGTPIQTWTQPQKINWLLYVVEQATGKAADLTPTDMFSIFSTKFRDSGLLTRSNIGRDLRNNSECFGSVDGRWFLKQAGKDVALKLVAEAKGEKPVA